MTRSSDLDTTRGILIGAAMGAGAWLALLACGYVGITALLRCAGP